MKSNKNHEGYHDPTACEAIRRAERQRRRKKRSSRLVYRIGDRFKICSS